MDGTTLRVLDTHLEAGLPAFSGPQATELVTLMTAEPGPVILLGDFNSGPGIDLTGYNNLTGARFVDVWSTRPNRGPGLTCCNAADLSNAASESEFDQRVDLVLTRDRVPSGPSIARGAHIAVVGEETGDLLLAPGGYLLWPSDHAGVVATLKLPPPIL